MAAHFVDSVSHYTSLLPKWDVQAFTDNNSIGINLTAGRFGGGTHVSRHDQNGYGYVGKLLDKRYGTLIAGFSFQQNTSGADPQGVVFSFADGFTRQISLTFDPNTLKLGVRQGDGTGAVIGTGTRILSNGVWYYVEVRAVFATSGGDVQVRIDGTQDIDTGAQNTAPSGNAGADRMNFGAFANSANVTCNASDWYLCDSLGPDLNTFLGDVRVQTLIPTGPGSNTTWTPFPNTDANWQAVKEIPPDGDTSYVSSLTPGQIDTYAHTSLAPTSGSVLAVQFVIDARKDDAGTRTIAPVVREGATNYVGSNIDVPSSYDFMTQIMETDPATGVAWTVAAVNADEFGVSMVS